MDPIKTHVNCFAALLFDGPVDKALGGVIFDLHWGRRLRVTDFVESGANGHRLLVVEISGANFGFVGRSHHIAHDFVNGAEWAIG